LHQGLAEELALIGGTGGGRKLFFEFEGGVQVFADTLELRSPGGEWIGFASIQHVAHS
jgi:hypothetical protein